LKVMLIVPPSQSAVVSFFGTGGPPLGLAYLASALEEEGHEVRVVDSIVMGYGLDELARELRAFDPDIVGLTATTPSIYSAYEVARLAKELLPNCTVVLGGPHASFTSAEVLRECPHVDVVVRGEGELTFCDLASRLARGLGPEGVRGTTYRKGKLVKREEPRPPIKEIDVIPWPAYHKLPMSRYRFEGLRFGVMLTSRGCPYGCIFCASSKLMGKVWRGRRAEDVVEEARFLMEEFGIREVEFLDDTFTLSMRRARQIADLMVREGLDLSWSCSSRANTMNEGLAKSLKRAGCHSVYLGVESVYQKTLNFLKKGITIRQVLDALRAIKTAGLNVVATFMLGIPCETREMMLSTIRFAVKTRPTLAQFTIFTPYPGTEAYEWAVREGALLTHDWSKYDTLTPVIKHPCLSPGEISSLLRRAYISFYASLSFVANALRKKLIPFLTKGLKRVFLSLKDYVANSIRRALRPRRARTSLGLPQATPCCGA